MSCHDDGWREEFKYWIAPSVSHRIREWIGAFAERDPYTGDSDAAGYVVRSIYYDTPGFDFYYHKLEGLKVRKKLRVRGYNHTHPDGNVFLEIKHKMGRKVFKERAFLPLDYSMRLLDAVNDGACDVPQTSRAARMTEQRFLWLKHTLGLLPAVLVVYDRVAFVGRDDPRIRITLDSRVRSVMFPSLDAMNNEDNLEVCSRRDVILELKFNGAMPVWMVDLVRGIGLSPTSISKYAMCVEHWMGDGCSRPEELHALARAG